RISVKPTEEGTKPANVPALLRLQFSEDMRFGLTLAEEPSKRLTYDPQGRSNNTRVLIDGADFLFGQTPGRWVQKKVQLANHDDCQSVCESPDSQVRVMQQVEIVPGEGSGKLDTCLVRYTVENHSGANHDVGLRVMLDTFIGADDGVPFLVPTEQEF